MSSFQVRQFDSIDALRAAAAAWDDLWRRSETTIPTARAELVAIWLEHFAPDATPRVLVVDDGQRMVAALPLIERRTCRVLRCGRLTSNYWSPNADLLLDPNVDAEPVLDVLVGVMKQLGWPLFWFDMVPVDGPHWQAMIHVFRRRGLAVDVHRRWQVGQIALDGDINDYFASRSAKLRRNLRRNHRRLESEGPLEFCLEHSLTPESVERRLQEVFTIEDRSWKGTAGSSALRNPTAIEFYRRQARQLADWGQLRVARLRQADRTIAFELGWLGAGVYHSFKIGYDPEYRAFGPGHVLREQLVRSLAEQGEVRAIDFQGPSTEALAAWATSEYPIARLVIAPRSASGRAAWAAYRALSRTVRLARRVRQASARTAAS
ncbi:MAG: GNAT family N-acetyltransferase [Pirellulales bacterium]|nr:GNAT family N-acetyltransferase [Pirellulales bacterium]